MKDLGSGLGVGGWCLCALFFLAAPGCGEGREKPSRGTLDLTVVSTTDSESLDIDVELIALQLTGAGGFQLERSYTGPGPHNESINLAPGTYSLQGSAKDASAATVASHQQDVPITAGTRTSVTLNLRRTPNRGGSLNVTIGIVHAPVISNVSVSQLGGSIKVDFGARDADQDVLQAQATSISHSGGALFGEGFVDPVETGFTRDLVRDGRDVVQDGSYLFGLSVTDGLFSSMVDVSFDVKGGQVGGVKVGQQSFTQDNGTGALGWDFDKDGIDEVILVRKDGLFHEFVDSDGDGVYGEPGEEIGQGHKEGTATLGDDNQNGKPDLVKEHDTDGDNSVDERYRIEDTDGDGRIEAGEIQQIS